MHTNSVDICGVVTDVRGGNTRNGSLWLLINIEVEIDGYTTRLPVWWFGKDKSIYRGVKEGSEVKVLGYLKWGKDKNDEWELRIVANVVSIEDDDGDEDNEDRRSRRNGRSERNARSNGRNGNGRKKADIEEEEEDAPF